jgi:hypothetical protein
MINSDRYRRSGFVLGFALLAATCPHRALASSEIAGQDATQGGFGRALPVITALEHFRRDTGRYPSREKELVPRYLADHRTFGQYRVVKDGTFALEYAYTRGSLPGLSVWTYYSATRHWVHSGYY